MRLSPFFATCACPLFSQPVEFSEDTPDDPLSPYCYVVVECDKPMTAE